MTQFKGTNNGYIQPRKISGSNLEGLFASLMHLISLSTVPYRQELTGILGIIYNRILYLYGMSPSEMISTLKLISKWYIELVRGGDLKNPFIDETYWSEDHGCPELLVGLLPIREKWASKSDISLLFFDRVIYSMLTCHRIIVIPVEPNHSSIVRKNKKGDVTLPKSSEIKAALESLGITRINFMSIYSTQVKDFNYEILNSQGPNGPATWTAHLDARAWNTRSKILAQFKTFLQESKFSRILTDMMGCIRVASKEIIPNMNPILGRLAYIEEWGGKCRIVAQLDYWTQMALTPLHHTINHFLKRINQDGTFDQDRIANVVRSWTALSTSKLYSFDLKTATDRLPIDLQVMILTELTGSKSLALAWEWILTYRGYLDRNGDYRTYNVGQPMGARSSFPMLALTHHVIMAIAAQRAGLKSFTEWVILGDDSTVNNELVSIQYKEIMAQLCVEIDLTKSVVHFAGSKSAAEICKRVFVNGSEISAINPKLIAKAIKDGREGPDLQNDFIRRGFDLAPKEFWLFMAAILDRDNLISLIKLNLVPTSISGLIRSVRPDTPLSDISTWLPEIPLTEKDLFELFTFVTATEGLKRLDSIYRSSSDMIDVLKILAASNANPKAIPQRVRDDWLSGIIDEEAKTRLEEVFKGIDSITYNHPILLAANAEANRLSELLHALNSLDTEMVNRARNGLLDMFRSAVGSIWEVGEPRKTQVSRSVFAKTLTTLVSMYTKWSGAEPQPEVPSINYSVVISTISRLWNVHFSIGSVCSVNALRSSVTRNVLHANSTLETALKGLSIVSLKENNSIVSKDLSTSPKISITKAPSGEDRAQD